MENHQHTIIIVSVYFCKAKVKKKACIISRMLQPTALLCVAGCQFAKKVITLQLPNQMKRQ